MSTSQWSWDDRFMGLALEVKTWSKDPDEGVGAVVVAPDKRQFSMGYNGFPRGSLADGRLLSKEEKNRLTIHAERNALDNAPFDLRGATIYVTKPPCFECMKGIVQKGIKRVVHPRLNPGSRWHSDQVDAQCLADDHSIKCTES